MAHKLGRASPPAAPAPEDALVAREIELFRILRVRRVEAIEACLGRRHRPNVLRSALVREIVLAFAYGRPMQVTGYQRLMVEYGSASNVRKTLYSLADDGLVILGSPTGAQRGISVSATEKLMSCYRGAWVRMSEEIRECFEPGGDGR